MFLEYTFAMEIRRVNRSERVNLERKNGRRDPGRRIAASKTV